VFGPTSAIHRTWARDHEARCARRGDPGVRLLLQLGLAAGVAAIGPLHATLTAPGHTPKTNTQWNYAVRATRDGKPVAARLTAQIVDPIGGRHPVTFGSTTKPITNWAFRGTFRDYIIWPASTRGVPLTLKLVVRAGASAKVIKYVVTPHG
jgi:hypothetical protein